MKSKENLVFLGMMGSGKSSIGMLVAKKLKLNFIDIDNEIENKVGTTISKMFEDKGEDFFRKAWIWKDFYRHAGSKNTFIQFNSYRF